MEQQLEQRGGYDLAQQITGLKRGTLYALVSRKRIPHRRLGRRLVIFDRAELERWLEGYAVATDAADAGEVGDNTAKEAPTS